MGVHSPDRPDDRRQPDRLTIRTLDRKLPQMLERAGWGGCAALTDMEKVRMVLPDVEACARETFISKRTRVKDNRGHRYSEAGIIRFGLEMRRQKNGDGGLALHVLADVGGSRGKNSRRGDGGSGVRLFLAGHPLPLRAAQQEPSDQLGSDRR